MDARYFGIPGWHVDRCGRCAGWQVNKREASEIAETLESAASIARDSGFHDEARLWLDAARFCQPDRLAMVRRQPALQAKLRATAEAADAFATTLANDARGGK